MPKFLIVLFLVLFVLPGFAQEGNDGGGGKVIIRETPVSETEPDPAINTGPDEDQAFIDAAEADRAEQLERTKAVETATEPIAQAKNPLEEIHKLGYEQINAAALMDDKVIAILQQTIRDGAMSQASDEDLKKMIKEKSKGTWLEKVFRRFPKLLSISSDIIRSKEAIPGLLGIMTRKDDLKTYGYVWVVIFIFGIYIKGKLVKPKWSFGRRFKWKFCINLILSSISLGVFYALFGEEIGPSLSIIGKHLF